MCSPSEWSSQGLFPIEKMENTDIRFSWVISTAGEIFYPYRCLPLEIVTDKHFELAFSLETLRFLLFCVFNDSREVM